MIDCSEFKPTCMHINLPRRFGQLIPGPDGEYINTIPCLKIPRIYSKLTVKCEGTKLQLIKDTTLRDMSSDNL